MWYLDDWMVFVVAAQALLAGVNPYTVGHGIMRLFNPIWVMALVLPTLLLPSYEAMFWTVEIAIVLSVLATARHFFPRRPVQQALIVASAGVFALITYGNLDAFVWAGVLAPTPAGLLLLALKPQATLLVIVVILLRHLDRHGVVSTGLVLLPLLLAVLVWVIIYGIPYYWINQAGTTANVGFWPYGLVVGVPVALVALGKRSVRLAMLAGPLCAPYMSINSYLAVSYAYPLLGFVLGWWKVVEQGTR